jgi:Phytochelatin synthase
MFADEMTHLLPLSSYQHGGDDDDNEQQSSQLQDATDTDDLQNERRIPLSIMTAVADVPPSLYSSSSSNRLASGQRHSALRHKETSNAKTDFMENTTDDSFFLRPRQQQMEQRQRVMVLSVITCCMCLCLTTGIFFGWSATTMEEEQQQQQPVRRERGAIIRIQPRDPAKQQSLDFLVAEKESAIHQWLLQRHLNTDTQIDQWEDWKKQHATSKQNNTATTSTATPGVNGMSVSSREKEQIDNAVASATAAALWEGILRGISIPNHGGRAAIDDSDSRTRAFPSTKMVRFIDYSDNEDALERFYEMTRYAPPSSSPMSSSDPAPPLQPDAMVASHLEVVNTALPDTATMTTADDSDVKEATPTTSAWKEKEAILEMEGEEKWHEVQQEMHNKEDVLKNDVEEKWHETQQELHNVWTRLQNKSSITNQHERTWWNQTVQDEDEWVQHVLQNLQTFGQLVSNWWMNATSTSKSREVQLQGNFQVWWSHAQDEERAWWNHTRSAYSNFCNAAKEKEHLWWNATTHVMQQGWNVTAHSAQGAWNTTSNAVHGTWNATHGTWNATQKREDEMLQNVKGWFKSHVTYHAQLTDLSSISYFNSSSDYSHLIDSAYGWLDNSNAFFRLVSSGWDAQVNQAYCAVASCAAVLNSMPIILTSDSDKTGNAVAVPILPMDPVYSPYRYATQQSILSSPCVNKHVIRYNESFDGVRRVPGGLSLNQAQKLLQCYLPTQYYDVTAVHVNPSTISLDEMRRDLYFALRDATARVVINFGRPALGQAGGGHFSPLVSYYSREDLFLILDVAKYKYPPVWVTAAQLYQAMSTLDVCGEWDYPRGQDILYGDSNHNTETDGDGGNHSSDNNNNEPLRYESNPQDYFQALHLLRCQTLHRGYIIVRPKSTTTTSSTPDNDNE